MVAKKKKKQNHIPRKKKPAHPRENREAKGVLDISRSGLGFVRIEGWDQDVLVRSGDMKNALDGDVVKVKVHHVSSKGRPEGIITEVAERKQKEFVGRIQVSDKFAFLVPDKDMRVDIYIPISALNGAKNDDRVVGRIVEWKAQAKNPTGEVVELLRYDRENEIAMKSILMENGFPIQFSDEVMEEAARLPDILDAKEIKNRRDCRDILTITIDPADAKDFDDAISVRKLKGDLLEVGVHIADVSYYVTPDSEMDKSAYERATSVYLPDRVLPMLPEHISNVLCSLRPNEDKFTFSAIFQMNAEGKIKQHWIGRTVIHSDRRFTYEEAQQIIETGEGEYKDEILCLHKIAQQLRAERFRKGAINFASQEVRFKLDEEGKPIGIELKESKEANQLIEELMLLANKTVAASVGKRVINQQTIPFPYRIHDVPNEDKLALFAAFAARFGHRFNLSNPDQIAVSFNQMLEEVKGKPEQHVLEQLGIRTMSKAVYSTENIGHYGLGFDEYCHFTSPIRRYPDIIVHRVMQQCIDDNIKIDKKMEQKCRHCSDQERNAMEAERAGDKYKQVEYMQQFIGEVFEAVVSGVSSFGFWAETVEHKCEGLIGLAELAEIDEFMFVEGDYALVGKHSGHRFRIGDKVNIQVISTSLEKRQIDFAYVPKVKSGAAEKKHKSGKPAASVKKKK